MEIALQKSPTSLTSFAPLFFTLQAQVSDPMPIGFFSMPIGFGSDAYRIEMRSPGTSKPAISYFVRFLFIFILLKYV